MSDPHCVEKASPESFLKRFSKFALQRIKKIATRTVKKITASAVAVWLGLLGSLILLFWVLVDTPRPTFSGLLDLTIFLGFLAIALAAVVLCPLFLLGLLVEFYAENKQAQGVEATPSPLVIYWNAVCKIIAPLLSIVLGLTVLGLIIGAVIVLFSAAPWWAALIILLLIVLILK